VSRGGGPALDHVVSAERFRGVGRVEIPFEIR